MKESFAFFHYIKTRFSEIDLHGHVYNGNYFSYFETAINEYCCYYGLLNKLYFDNQDPVFYVFSVAIQYYKPIAFNQKLKIGVRISEIRSCSIKFELEIFCTETNHVSTKSEIIWVKFNKVKNEKSALTKEFIEKVKEVTDIVEHKTSK